MPTTWTGMSYSRFPSFTSQFKRALYEEWQEELDLDTEEVYDIDEDEGRD